MIIKIYLNTTLPRNRLLRTVSQNDVQICIIHVAIMMRPPNILISTNLIILYNSVFMEIRH